MGIGYNVIATGRSERQAVVAKHSDLAFRAGSVIVSLARPIHTI